jgi:ParB family chromosome partitioning protein
MDNKRRLGKGLEALLGGMGNFSEPESVNSISVNSIEVRHAPPNNKVDITKIEPNPFQPRKFFDEAELKQLARNIETQGLAQPIALRQVGERYQIIAGERRYRAVLLLGWGEIPAYVLEADDQQMAELALTENIQRKDLNAIEKAISFTNYLETFGGTHEELAKRLEIDRSTVTNLLRLLSLPQQIQDAVSQDQISPGHARALLPLHEWEWEQIGIATKIQDEGWSVRETEKFVSDLLQTGQAELPKNKEQTWNIVGKDGESRAISQQSEHIQQLETEFRRYLGGVKVKVVQTNDKGKGKLVVTFAKHADFEHIYAAICKPNRAAG